MLKPTSVLRGHPQVCILPLKETDSFHRIPSYHRTISSFNSHICCWDFEIPFIVGYVLVLNWSNWSKPTTSIPRITDPELLTSKITPAHMMPSLKLSTHWSFSTLMLPPGCASQHPFQLPSHLLQSIFQGPVPILLVFHSMSVSLKIFLNPPPLLTPSATSSLLNEI